MIDITGVNLVEFVKAAYDLSEPRGMGFLHYTEGPLTDDEANEIVSHPSCGQCVLNMDYIKGRAVKMRVYKEREKLVIGDSWFDHTPEQLKSLLAKVGAMG